MTALQFAEATGSMVAIAVGLTFMFSSDREMNRLAWAFAALWLVAVVVLACVNG